ncbi:RAC-alpha serine/threonine-protein kinase [Salvia divinorum]|uniref:RAC-alpha serine/threonine-protein kinase n=1 Tax=Salvia divinorum TaxID=28513 RepID=A0ABD1GUC7_SALDI
MEWHRRRASPVDIEQPQVAHRWENDIRLNTEVCQVCISWYLCKRNGSSWNQLPSYLDEQMISHTTLNFKTNLEGLQQQVILDSLPNAIRTSISHHLFHSVIDKVYVFHGVSDELLFHLVREMRAEYFSPNKDVIFQYGEPTYFYIIVSRAVELLIMKNEAQVTSCGEARKGESFGEIGVVCFKPQLFTFPFSVVVAPWSRSQSPAWSREMLP